MGLEMEETVKIKYYLQFPAGGGGNYLLGQLTNTGQHHSSEFEFHPRADQFFIYNQKQNYTLNDLLSKRLQMFGQLKYCEYVYGHSYPYLEDDYYNLEIDYYTNIRCFCVEEYVYVKLLKFVKHMLRDLTDDPYNILFLLKKLSNLVPNVNKQQGDYRHFIQTTSEIPAMYKGLNSMCIGYSLFRLGDQVKSFDEYFELLFSGFNTMQDKFMEHNSTIDKFPTHTKNKKTIGYSEIFLDNTQTEIFDTHLDKNSLQTYTANNVRCLMPVLTGQYEFIKHYLQSKGY